MGRNALSCGAFTCPECTLHEHQLHDSNPAALEGARRLCLLEGSRLAHSSQNAYASALRRYVKCMTEVFSVGMEQALPPGHLEAVPLHFIKLFLGWAA